MRDTEMQPHLWHRKRYFPAPPYLPPRRGRNPSREGGPCRWRMCDVLMVGEGAKQRTRAVGQIGSRACGRPGRAGRGGTHRTSWLRRGETNGVCPVVFAATHQ